jgi:Ca2+-binding EF-hand superfamily protein
MFDVSSAIEPLRPHAHHSFGTLVNSFAVLFLCQKQWLVSLAPSVLRMAQTLRLSTQLNFLLRHSFYKHFCGGESLKSVAPLIQNLKKQNVGAILDLAIEADLDSKSLDQAAQLAHTTNIVFQMKRSVDIAATEPDSFIAAKVTSWLPPHILLSWSSTLDSLMLNFQKVSNGKSSIDFNLFSKMHLIDKLPLQKQKELFQNADINNDGLITLNNLTSVFSLYDPVTCQILIDVNSGIKRENLEECKQLLKIVDELCQYAQEHKVKIMIDAEQTYFQSAINNLTLSLCKKYNCKNSDDKLPTKWTGPLIFNTYQMYLKQSLDNLISDVGLSKELGHSLGIKIVRGAYMISERERAIDLKIHDPIHSSITDTHESYNKAITFLISEIKTYKIGTGLIRPISFVVASHNKYSIGLACELSMFF